MKCRTTMQCFRCYRYKVSFNHTCKLYTIPPLPHFNLLPSFDPHKDLHRKKRPQMQRPLNSSLLPSKMFLPEPKPHLPTRRLLSRPLDIPRRRIRPAEINPHIRFQTPLQPADIRTIHNAIPHGTEKPLEIRSAEISPRCQFREGIFGDTDAVEVDVCRGIKIQALREIGVDSQEFRAGAGIRGCVLGLGFKAAEKSLEPFEGAGVLADPDEFDSSEACWRVGAGTEMPDVF